MAALKIENVTLHGLAAHPRVTIDRLRHGRYQPPPRTRLLAVYGHLSGDTDTRAAEIMEATFSNLGTDRDFSDGNQVAILKVVCKKSPQAGLAQR